MPARRHSHLLPVGSSQVLLVTQQEDPQHSETVPNGTPRCVVSAVQLTSGSAWSLQHAAMGVRLCKQQTFRDIH